MRAVKSNWKPLELVIFSGQLAVNQVLTIRGFDLMNFTRLSAGSRIIDAVITRANVHILQESVIVSHKTTES